MFLNLGLFSFKVVGVEKLAFELLSSEAQGHSLSLVSGVSSSVGRAVAS